MTNRNEPEFDWSQEDGNYPPDQMNRAEHARNLTRFLVQKGKEANYVLNINAKWGTGKTYFMKRWSRGIGTNYPTVYIDAWSSDHSDNPLLSVVSEVLKKLQSLKNISKFEAGLLSGLAKVAKAGAPALAKVLIDGQLKKLNLSTGGLEELFSADEIASAGSSLVKQAIKAHDEAAKGVGKMKESIQDWLASVIADQKVEYPLFIFIDELDRCRPTYAIEMLETIKHIFDMQNVVFVIATDKEQLQHSIRAIYGSGFDSRLYLDRFFTRSVSLNDTSRKEYLGIKVRNSPTLLQHAGDDSNFAFLASQGGREEDIVSLLASIADGMQWPLRTVNLWFDRLESALIMSAKKLEIIFLSVLLALETDNPIWTDNLKNGKGVLRLTNNDSPEYRAFVDFPLTIKWNFSLAKDILNLNSLGPGSIDYTDKLQLTTFFTNQKNSFGKDTAKLVADIRQELSYVQSNSKPRTVNYSSDNNGPFPPVVFLLYLAFHQKHKTEFSDYLDICRYSSLMN